MGSTPLLSGVVSHYLFWNLMHDGLSFFLLYCYHYHLLEYGFSILFLFAMIIIDIILESFLSQTPSGIPFQSPVEDSMQDTIKGEASFHSSLHFSFQKGPRKEKEKRTPKGREGAHKFSEINEIRIRRFARKENQNQDSGSLYLPSLLPALCPILRRVY